MTSLRWPFVLAFALVSLFVLAACGDGGGEGPSIPSPTPTGGETQDGQPAETPTVAAQPTPTQQAERTGSNGTHDCTVEISKDPGGSAGEIGMPEMLTLTLSETVVTDTQVAIRIESPLPWIDLEGIMRSDGSLTASGMDDVGGFQDIDAGFDGTFVEEGQFRGVTPQFNGDLTLGLAGGLPQGQPIIYFVACASSNS